MGSGWLSAKANLLEFRTGFSLQVINVDTTNARSVDTRNFPFRFGSLLRPGCHLSDHLLELIDLRAHLPELNDGSIDLDIRLRALDLLVPALALPVDFSFHLLPLLNRVVISLMPLPIMFYLARFPDLYGCCDEQQRAIYRAHDIVVQPLVPIRRHPPLKRDDEAEDLDQIKGRDEDVLVRRADEPHRLLRKERHVLVNSIVGNVLVGTVVEGDEDVKQDHHHDEGEDVVENQAPGRRVLVEAVEVRGLHDAVGHGLDDEGCHSRCVFGLVEADEGLKEADDDNGEEREEDEGFFHHDFENDEHAAEEAEGVEVEHQAEPEHGGGEGEDVVGELIERDAALVVDVGAVY